MAYQRATVVLAAGVGALVPSSPSLGAGSYSTSDGSCGVSSSSDTSADKKLMVWERRLRQDSKTALHNQTKIWDDAQL